MCSRREKEKQKQTERYEIKDVKAERKTKRGRGWS
jgi:hypothetical protein